MATTPPSSRPPVRWRPRARPLAALVAVAFLALTGFLGYRVSAGEDPALGAGTKAQVTRPAEPAVPDQAVQPADGGDGGDAWDDGGAYEDDGGGYQDDGFGEDGTAPDATQSAPAPDATQSPPAPDATQSAPANPSTGSSGG